MSSPTRYHSFRVGKMPSFSFACRKEEKPSGCVRRFALMPSTFAVFFALVLLLLALVLLRRQPSAIASSLLSYAQDNKPSSLTALRRSKNICSTSSGLSAADLLCFLLLAFVQPVVPCHFTRSNPFVREAWHFFVHHAIVLIQTFSECNGRKTLQRERETLWRYCDCPWG